jgi:hypothetical protein
VRHGLSRRVIVGFELAVHDILADLLFEPRPHQIMVVEIDDVNRMRDREIAVAFDDEKVFVVAIGSLNAIDVSLRQVRRQSTYR